MRPRAQARMPRPSLADRVLVEVGVVPAVAAAMAAARPARRPDPALAFRLVTRYAVTRYEWRRRMAAPAERMKAMRQRRRARGLRELRLVVADARSRTVRRRVARDVAGLDPDRERDALRWTEAVSEFDADATR